MNQQKFLEMRDDKTPKERIITYYQKVGDARLTGQRFKMTGEWGRKKIRDILTKAGVWKSNPFKSRGEEIIAARREKV